MIEDLKTKELKGDKTIINRRNFTSGSWLIPRDEFIQFQLEPS